MYRKFLFESFRLASLGTGMLMTFCGNALAQNENAVLVLKLDVFCSEAGIVSHFWNRVAHYKFASR